MLEIVDGQTVLARLIIHYFSSERVHLETVGNYETGCRL